MQPLFGHLADRGRLAWLVPAGILFAGIGVSLVVLVPSYWMMLVAVALSGLGIAAFHPEATLLVNHVSDARKATAMGTFALGGNVGFAVGPLVTTACVLALGFRGAALLIIPAVLYAAVVARQMSRFTSFTDKARADHAAARTAARDAWRPFAWLTGTVICRSIVFFGLNTFLALYWIDALHRSKAAGNTALSILLLSGAIGTVTGGRLADAIGNGRVLTGSLLIVPLFLAALVTTTQVWLATALLVPLGLLMSAPFGVMVLMGQQYLPNHPGAASGVTLGFAAKHRRRGHSDLRKSRRSLRPAHELVRAHRCESPRLRLRGRNGALGKSMEFPQSRSPDNRGRCVSAIGAVGLSRF